MNAAVNLMYWKCAFGTFYFEPGLESGSSSEGEIQVKQFTFDTTSFTTRLFTSMFTSLPARFFHLKLVASLVFAPFQPLPETDRTFSPETNTALRERYPMS